MTKVAILWEEGPTSGYIAVRHGTLGSCKVGSGSVAALNGDWTITESDPLRVEIEVNRLPGNNKTVVTIHAAINPFSFFISDVCKEYPIYIPAYGVAVTEHDDPRSYSELQKDIADRGLLTNLAQLEAEHEECFEAAAARTRNQPCPTWLGTGRDARIFETQSRGRGSNNFWSAPVVGSDLQWDWIQPRMHGIERGLPENEGKAVRYYYMLGRGIGCTDPVTRSLEDGTLPILNQIVVDDEVQYHSRSFVSYESIPLQQETVMGTHYLIADGYGFGHMLTDEQTKLRTKLLDGDTSSEENTLFYSQITITNTGKVPRYAWYKNVVPNVGEIPYSFDSQNGYGQFTEDRVFAITLINGQPLNAEEVALLLKPGEKLEIHLLLPHEPISKQRAERLRGQNMNHRLEECRSFWKRKSDSSAQIKLPEKRIEEMIQAGLLHLDISSYGEGPDGTIVPAIGIYTAIGSESSPIIQFMDTMGLGETAERALSFFLEKQHDDGFIQNFGGYMLETGAALWCMGEHYRYTQDKEWVNAIKPKLMKSYSYLLRWRERNISDELDKPGNGMIDGKTADPEDPYHSFMLNGYAYLGLSRLSEMLAESDPELAEKIKKTAILMKDDIRKSFLQSVALSPVVPLGDGSWVPTAPPWVEAKAPLALYETAEKCFTHGTFVARDSILGPLHLLFHEVIDVNERAADFMLSYHNELMYTQNVGFSQPYYCIHPWAHIKRGEVKAFLKAYYNSFAGLADRETYTFWEHYYQVSPHKTHEEAWFLMQSRWMLYMEEGDQLQLLPAIPRKWLEQDKEISLNNVNSYFGKFSLTVKSDVRNGVISAKFICEADRKPSSIKLRLPHPSGKKGGRVIGGEYKAEEEAVIVDLRDCTAEIMLYF
ncbi:glucosidase family protein [Paenibacillus sp. strain BS8-2]